MENKKKIIILACSLVIPVVILAVINMLVMNIDSTLPPGYDISDPVYFRAHMTIYTLSMFTWPCGLGIIGIIIYIIILAYRISGESSRFDEYY